jgi:hypothetical protein
MNSQGESLFGRSEAIFEETGILGEQCHSGVLMNAAPFPRARPTVLVCPLTPVYAARVRSRSSGVRYQSRPQRCPFGGANRSNRDLELRDARNE